MAIARAICTCVKCGTTFEKTATKRNREDADRWVEWARQTFDECPACYGKRMREEEAQKPLTIEVKLDPYAQMLYFVATGNTFPHKDDLKECGYRWDEEPCSGLFGLFSTSKPKKVWKKAVKFDEFASDRMKEELEKAKDLGADVVISISEIDMQAGMEVYRKKTKEKEAAEKESAVKEAAKAALERPVRPDFIPDGYWNGKIYGKEKYGYYIFIENKRCDISSEQRDEILEYQQKKDDYRAKIEEIEKGNAHKEEAQ